MESVYKLSVILNLVDNLSSQMNGVQSSVSGSVSKLNSAFGTMQKAGAAMAGIGGTITGLAMKTVTATFDTQNALGELSSLGVKDLKAVEDAAKSFSDTWAGTSKADFITASYDIKSGIASLTDEGVAQFTQLAALTGKATKSTTEEMGSLFATGYGIYKGFYDDMSDLEFGEMFSAGIATAVKNYKTSGSEMASAISALGATATNANVPLEEQLAIMGQLQTTMSGSEAATKYKSFLNQASSAGEKLGLTFLDTNNQETVQSIMNIALKLGVFLVIAGSVMGVIGSLGKLFLSAKNAIGLVKTATLGMNTAFLASPITWVIAGIVALVAAFVVLWNKSEAFRGFWIGLFEQVKSSFMQAWQTLKPALQNLGQKFMELYQAVQPILEVLGAVLGAVLTVALGHFVGCIQGIISALTPLTNALSSLVSFVTNVVNMIVSLFKGDFSGALDFASAAVGDLKDFFFNCFDAIISFLGGFASGFLDVVGGALSAIGIDATETITKMKDTIKNGLEAVKGFFGNILGAASDTVKEKLGNMKAAYEEHGGGIKGVAAAAVEGVKGYYTAGFTFIDNLTGGKLTNIKNQFSEKMSGVANAVSSGMSAAKNYASTQLSNMQAAYQSSGGGIKGIVAATMTGVQGTFSTAYSVINNLTGGKLESIRSTISNKIQAAKDTVSSVLDSIKSAFSSKLEAARSVVSSTIEKIKGVFNFSWKLPDLKLPHISVNGGQAPYGIGGKGSLPSFSIQWYKEGGILNGATIFGAMGGNLLGGGEAGAEAVLPLSELWKQMTEIVKGVVKGENEESGDTVQQTGANITSALTSKAASVRKEKESKTTTTKETYTSERWGKEGGTTIHQISFTVDISKIKDLPLLYKLIDELKDAQNRTDSPTPATT